MRGTIRQPADFAGARFDGAFVEGDQHRVQRVLRRHLDRFAPLGRGGGAGRAAARSSAARARAARDTLASSCGPFRAARRFPALPRLAGWIARLLAQTLADAGEPAYRAAQVWEWVARGARGYEEMTNLPAALRERLAGRCRSRPSTLPAEAKSDDGTVKALFETADGRPLEAVLMRYRDGRRSVCLSSQSGCPLTCTFCATGQMKFGRNLSADEILDQALHFRRLEAIDHVVFMGMGEPTMNIDNVLAACERLPDLGVTHRRTAISTVGWVPGIDRLAECEMPIALALSLHAPNDGLRSQLMPVNDRYPLAEVLAACERYRAAPPPQGLRRVRDARRRQRPARARPPARRPARPAAPSRST